MMQREPARALAVIDAAYGGQEQMGEHVIMISYAPAEQKLAWFLQRLGERLGQNIGDQFLVDLPMMRADIADHLGMTFETVSREMTKLRDNSIIKLVGLRRFTIMRPSALDSLAHAGSFSTTPTQFARHQREGTMVSAH